MRRLWHAFLRLFFRLLYDEFAWAYDLVAWLVSLGHWKAWGRATLPHLRGAHVLELGHGPGHLLVTLKQRGFDPVGLDLSRRMGYRAQTRLRRASLSVPVLQAQAQALPFNDLTFDTIVATFPTDFILAPATRHEVMRILRPNGRLIVALWARFDGEGVQDALLNWLHRSTGQNEPRIDGFAGWLADGGMLSRVVRERVGRTTVMLVVAEKR